MAAKTSQQLEVSDQAKASLSIHSCFCLYTHRLQCDFLCHRSYPFVILSVGAKCKDSFRLEKGSLRIPQQAVVLMQRKENFYIYENASLLQKMQNAVSRLNEPLDAFNPF